MQSTLDSYYLAPPSVVRSRLVHSDGFAGLAVEEVAVVVARSQSVELGRAPKWVGVVEGRDVSR